MNADVHALAGAYALDALPPEEAAAFTEHVAECSACQQEVAELQVTAAQLGLTVTQAPPAALRDQVLRAVQQTRQIPPVTPPADLSARRRRRVPRLVAAAAAAVVILAGALAVGPVLDELGEPAPQEMITRVIQDPGADTAATQLRGGGKLTVVRSENLDAAVVLGEDLPELNRDRVYQLWLVGPGGTARPADVLIDGNEPSRGKGSLVEGLHPGDRFAITREPAGGSQQPTTTPLGVVDHV